MPPVIDYKKCKACGTCNRHCPGDVILQEKRKKAYRIIPMGMLALWFLPAGLPQGSDSYCLPTSDVQYLSL